MIYEVKPTNIADIRAGDTVEHNGRVMTVCFKDIVRGGFMGTTLFGERRTDKKVADDFERIRAIFDEVTF